MGRESTEYKGCKRCHSHLQIINKARAPAERGQNSIRGSLSTLSRMAESSWSASQVLFPLLDPKNVTARCFPLLGKALMKLAWESGNPGFLFALVRKRHDLCQSLPLLVPDSSSSVAWRGWTKSGSDKLCLTQS